MNMYAKSSLTKDLFAESYARGVPIKQILKALRISERCARYWVKELGLLGVRPMGRPRAR